MWVSYKVQRLNLKLIRLAETPIIIDQGWISEGLRTIVKTEEDHPSMY